MSGSASLRPPSPKRRKNINVQDATLIYFGINHILWCKTQFEEAGNMYCMNNMHPMRKLIDKDINTLRKGNFKVNGSWSVSGRFKRIREDSKVWVYLHGGHVTTSSAEYSSFSACLSIKTVASSFGTCHGRQHNILQPYFADNETLREIVEWQNLEMQALLSKLSSGGENSPGLSDMCGLLWKENEWSKRLCIALNEHLPNYIVEYTAENGPDFRTCQSVLSGLPATTSLIQCYPFHGCTDLIICKKPSINPVANVLTANEEDAPQSSGEENCVENGKQADGTKEIYPNKLGQLLAAMYISVIQKGLRMFIQGHSIKRILAAGGLYINKSSGSFLLNLKLPVVEIGTAEAPITEVEVSAPRCYTLSESSLCYSLGRLVETNCNTTQLTNLLS